MLVVLASYILIILAPSQHAKGLLAISTTHGQFNAQVCCHALAIICSCSRLLCVSLEVHVYIITGKNNKV